MAGWLENWRERRRKNKSGGCDGCDSGGCDGPCMMLSISTLLPQVIRTAPSNRRRRAVPTLPAVFGLRAIRGYQRRISPHLRTQCRFTPSCSEYGAQAVRRYGLADGSRMAGARISRCTRDVAMGTADPLR